VPPFPIHVGARRDNAHLEMRALVSVTSKIF
jgi:hypothetical protein